jgi:hypothetical protein
LLAAYANRGLAMSAIDSGTSSGVGTGTCPSATPPAYVSLVEAKKTTPVSAVSHSRTFSVASVLTWITRAGSAAVLRTPTTAASTYTWSHARGSSASAAGAVRSALTKRTPGRARSASSSASIRPRERSSTSVTACDSRLSRSAR